MLAGNVTLGDILEILPFEDPAVVLELDGGAIWDAMESALSTWPAQEGYVTSTVLARICKMTNIMQTLSSYFWISNRMGFATPPRPTRARYLAAIRPR